MEKIGKIEKGEEEIEKEWGRIEEKLRKAMTETEKKMRKRRIGKREWWDEECEEEKKVRGELRKWRREGGEGEEYRKMRIEYKKLCDKKKR